MHVWEKISENHAKCVSLDRSDWEVYRVPQDLPLNLQCLLKCNVAFNRNYRSFEMRVLILPDASLQFLKPFNFHSRQQFLITINLIVTIIIKAAHSVFLLWPMKYFTFLRFPNFMCSLVIHLRLAKELTILIFNISIPYNRLY